MVEIDLEYGKLKVERHQNCQRCGRKLTNEKSISLGFGPKCYRIVQLQKPVEHTTDEIKFVKMEISMLKRQIKGLKDRLEINIGIDQSQSI